jgi:ribonuclease BN (tRNA processing enzyme)
MAKGARTTAFLVDDDILIDAGTGLGELSIDELCSIDHILLTHSHLDHVLGVPLLADVAFKRRLSLGRPPIQVHALPETLDALRQHIFNQVIWPDFTILPTVDRPILQLIPLRMDEPLALGTQARRITPLPANHTVPAVGFAVQANASTPAWVYSGDTAECLKFWMALKNLPIQVLVMENAFAQADEELADISRHHSTPSLTRALKAWPGLGRTQVAITHIKPGEEAMVLQELTKHLGAYVQLCPLHDCPEMTISEQV